MAENDRITKDQLKLIINQAFCDVPDEVRAVCSGCLVEQCYSGHSFGISNDFALIKSLFSFRIIVEPDEHLCSCRVFSTISLTERNMFACLL